MFETQPGIPSVLRNRNRSTVLNVIQRHGPLSRADIARITGISPPTVSKIVRHYVERGLLRQEKALHSSGGARPILVELRSDSMFTVGVDMGSHSADVALVDLEGRIAESLCGALALGSTGAFIDALVERVHGLLRAAAIPPHRVLGVGIGVPGVIDPDDGDVVWAPAFGIHQMATSSVGLRETLQARLGMPVFLENDVNAVTLGERRIRGNDVPSNFVFVAMRQGVGAGIVLDGQLYRGHCHAAGEVGYLNIDPQWYDGPLEDVGCLESLASTDTVVQEANQWLAQQGYGSSFCSYGDLQSAAKQGPSEVTQAFHRALDRLTTRLAVGIANIVAVINPEMVIIGDNPLLDGEVVVAALKEKLPRICPIPVVVERAHCGLTGGVIGSAAMALEACWHHLVED